MNLSDLIDYYRAGRAFHASLIKANTAIEQRIRTTPTSNVFHTRSVLWLEVIGRHILPPEIPEVEKQYQYNDGTGWVAR